MTLPHIYVDSGEPDDAIAMGRDAPATEDRSRLNREASGGFARARLDPSAQPQAAALRLARAL